MMESTAQTLPIEMLDVDAIRTDPAAYQFRKNCDANGVTKEWQITADRWDPILHGNPLLVHKRLSGEYFVVDGHHRLDFARRMGVDKLNVQVLDEARGYSIDRVKLIAAEKNIVKGHASKVEAARVLKEEKAKNFDRFLLTSWQPDHVIVKLSGLSDASLDMVEQCKVPVESAVYVAEHVPDADHQDRIFRKISLKLHKDDYPTPGFNQKVNYVKEPGVKIPVRFTDGSSTALVANEQAAGFVARLRKQRESLAASLSK
jgi:hypothetical protein